MSEKIDNFFIKKNYQINLKKEIGVDDFTEKYIVYDQPYVYEFTKFMAQKLGSKYIIDVGCVHHEHLIELYPEFQIIGIGHGENLEYCKKHYTFAEWIEIDFSKEIIAPISKEILKNSIIVCGDIIEHLNNPMYLLKILKEFLNYSPNAILTAINRDGIKNNDEGPPLNPNHVREWNLSEFKQFILENFNLSNIGLTINNHYDKEKNVIIALLENNNKNIADNLQIPKDFSVVALIHSFNEEDIIIPSIMNLLNQGIGVYVLDNWSTDKTFQLLTEIKHERFLGVERFPNTEPEYYDLESILKRKEEISQEFGKGWYMHTDVDEIRVSPWKDINLRYGIYLADSFGYNAIDFSVLTFHPIDNNFKSGTDFESYFRHFSLGEHLSYFIQVKVWKNFGQKISLAYWGGHNVEFEGRKIFPLKFLCKHYPIRSQLHGEKKIFTERRKRYHPKNRAKGWHAHYNDIKKEHDFIKLSSELLYQKEDFHEQFILERLASVGILSDKTIANARLDDFQIQWIDKHRKILAIGSATGYVAKILKQICNITTLVNHENNESENYSDKIIVWDGSINNINKLLKNEKFDAIELGNILSKINEPEKFLVELKKNITEDGFLICFFHNFSHGYITLYKEGIEKNIKSHIFQNISCYDLDSIRNLFDLSGYVILDLERIKVNIFDAYDSKIDPKTITRKKIMSILENPEATTLYYVMKIRKSKIREILEEKNTGNNKFNYKNFVRECYIEFLKREPDVEGLEHYVRLLQNNEIDEYKLVEIFKNSEEYRQIKF